MEAVLSRLRELSADELRQEFARADLKCGPITATTRALFERKLARVLAGPEGSATETDSNSAAGDSVQGGLASRPNQSKPAPCTASAAVSSSSSSNTGSSVVQAAGDEADFGYGMGLNPPEEEEISVQSRTSSNIYVEDSLSHPKTETPSKPAQASPTFFYGVCPLWDDVLARNERAHVYTDKKDALQVVKMMKGARFKAFPNREDAERFAMGICDYYPSPSKSTPCLSPIKPGLVLCKDNIEVDAANRERANSFKSPRTQDLTAKLRISVEKGDETAFSELVWSNPRYLIGSGDNPTIVQEGCRYNVMHVAAKENQAAVVQLLLDTLENPDFMRLMYPDDQELMLQKRIRYIIDLYLNTPDKAGFETPLHFACKFGCPEVVNVLCSYPDIDKNCKNKYGQKPCEVVCDRKNKTQEVKQKILDYLEDRCYIPLLRATDNSSQPIIGTPWSPEPSDSMSHALSPRHVRSPIDPVMTVKAYAGPLSPSKADEFRRAWKTPPRDRAELFHHILKSDPDRGAERVGRNLAHELGHPWAEYWDFLDSFVDLSSAEGLRKLEEYLSKKDFSQRAHDEAGENEASNRFRTPSPGKPKKFCNSISVGAFLDEGDDISLEEMNNRHNAALTSSPCSKESLQGAVGGHEFHILPRTRADLIETAAEHDLLCCCHEGLLSPGDACKDGLCSAASTRDRTHNGVKASSRLSPSSSSSSSSSSAELSGGLSRLALGPGRDGPTGGSEREAEEQGQARRTEVGAGDRAGSGSDESFDTLDGPEGSGQRTRGPVVGRTFCARSKSWDHGGRDLSSSASPGSHKSFDSSSEFLSRTPPRIRRGLFIDGDLPSKLDTEVMLAIETIDVDPQKYPSIHKWKRTLGSYSHADMQSWPSPAVLKSRPRLPPPAPGSPAGALASPTGRFSPARHAYSSPDFSPGRYSPGHASYIQRIRLKHFSEPPV